MKDASLDELKVEFDKWRKKKRHIREAVPEALMERARQAISVHGIKRVVKATRIERSRLTKDRSNKLMSDKVQVDLVPSYSKVELVAPEAKSSPIAEVETPTGLKLRIFTPTKETLDLLSSICGIGGVR
jgi:hypothetical protein